MLSVIYVECGKQAHCAECHVEYRYPECRYPECRGSIKTLRIHKVQIS
jgi:hypothetical protein